jgi:CheY-specific phosphatase CheX
MISEQAKSAFDFFVDKALRTNLLGSMADAGQIERLAMASQIKSRRMVILTISGYAFRAMLFMHYTPDAPTRAHIAELKQQPELDEAGFTDAIMEFGNLACGAINRELGEIYPHLGMSTPSVLEHGSLEYVNALGAGHVSHWRIGTPSGAQLYASLAVCEDEDIDFRVDQSQVEDTSGELEMF